MICEKLNIKLCPICSSFGSRYGKCWVSAYKERLDGNIKDNIKKWLIIRDEWQTLHPNTHIDARIYFDAAVKEYYPEYIDFVNKLSVLL